MRKLITLRLAGLFLGVMMTIGCSTFERDWQRTTALPSDKLAGPWIGTWRSNVNGHNDELRCLVTPLTNNVYSARYHAKYRRGILRFTFGYTVPLSVTNREGTFTFSGESNLGWYAGGVYRYQGTATATNFFSTYDSKYDRGTFQMRRPD
jgi:hypothetical protein